MENKSEGRAKTKVKLKSFNEAMESRKRDVDMQIIDEIMRKEKMGLDKWLHINFPSTRLRNWREIRLFLSSTFVDTQAERDVLIKRVIPSLNRQLASRWIRVIPVDLRWGVLHEESKDCETIQKTCLTQIDKCRQVADECPWFLSLRTDRYGWVQDKLMESKNSEMPRKYEWLDKFREYGKHVSITSLECMHASVPPKRMINAPNVFFYKRRITNPNDIEPNMRWVFDFEYVPEDAKLDSEVEFQYSKSRYSDIYREDKGNLDVYLKSLIHVKYSTYECQYKKGGAQYTEKNENSKSYGVGYVQGLSKFEKQVEHDLLQAIQSNFGDMGALDVLEHVLDTIQHEDVAISKAYTFVGRSDLYRTVVEHCTSQEIDRNVMVIHGEHGCGKTTLLAAVSQQCLNEMRTNGGFVFMHFVNSCPSSNTLEFMLRRLQLNLREYRTKLGDTSISEKCPNTAADLKLKHTEFLCQSATKYPDKMFIIFVDAIDQFDTHLSDRTTWWLPQDVPSNLRFVITTSDKDNVGAFENACQVPITSMSREDRRKMVWENLERFNKKLTEDQLNLLLSKSESPLYLIAAIEAVRKFGVYEKVKEYIESLPNTIAALFDFLLDEWSDDHGEEFVKNVTSLICLSKDGLLENQINDILSFREEREERYSYYSSFSRLYDSICSFISAGGGGYLRFSHTELASVVRRKYFTTMEIESEVHGWLAEFFYSCVSSQLCDRPNSEVRPAYYQHCLQQVVYHQLFQAEVRAGRFKDTLRNIYFVRERVKHKQEHSLRIDYLNAIENSCDVNEKKALKQWAEFAQHYFSYISQFPDWSHNMAANQPLTSFVALDTGKLPVPECCGGYPLYWCNKPHNSASVEVNKTSDLSKEDVAVTVRYQKSETAEVYISCAATSRERNLCCFGTKNEKAFVFKQDTGALVHEVSVKSNAWSIYFSTRFDTLWIGHSGGFISVWNAETATEEWMKEIVEKKTNTDDEETCGVTWIEEVGEYVACGTYEKYGDAIGRIAIVDEGTRNVITSWSTELECYSYCFQRNNEMIFSGHEDLIKGWTTRGDLVMSIVIDGKVASLCSHPKEKLIVYVLEKGRRKYCMKQLDISTKEHISSTPGTGSIALYDITGERILCTSADRKTIGIYNADGCHLENECKEHAGDINKISLLPERGLILTAARDDGKLFSVPISHDRVLQPSSSEVITWCDFFPGGEKIATLSNTGKLSVWLISTSEPYISIDIQGAQKAVIHPTGAFICVCTNKDFYWRRVPNLEEVSTFNISSRMKDGENNNKMCVNDVKISNDSLKCVLATKGCGSIVLNIEDIGNTSERHAYVSHGEVFSCDIHSDNVRVVSAYRKSEFGYIEIWNMINNETITRFDDIGWPKVVRFVPESSRVLYGDGRCVRATDLSEGSIHTTDTGLKFEVDWDPVVSLLRNGSQLLRGEGRLLHICDLDSGKQRYTFVDPDHRSAHFTCLSIHPSTNMVICANKNGNFYILKTKRD